jgi:hypothetical protein
VVVAGYASADKFLNAPKKDVWRVQHPEMKKLIWAPHFTIRNDGSPFTLSNFLWMAEPMLQLAKTHKDSLHIAMKPHPRLKTELYEHQDWGREKTDAYYAEWEQMENTQLEVGDFADLFAGSDAMIHDCGSFLCDYLYFRKPVMFVSQHIAQAKACVNDFGKMAYDMHYIGKTIDDIHRFIEQQVMKGDDPMKEKRDGFFCAVLRRAECADRADCGSICAKGRLFVPQAEEDAACGSRVHADRRRARCNDPMDAGRHHAG